MHFLASAIAVLAGLAASPSQSVPRSAVLFENVRIFNGTDRLTAPSNVLVVGNVIQAVSTNTIEAPAGAIRISGGGRTLMPGLIDMHVHLAFATIPAQAAILSDPGFVHIAAGRAAEGTLMRGFTTIRDMDGPVFGLKQAIDTGLVPGPRVWPSGAFLSQSGGHGDLRLPFDFPATSDLHFTERLRAAAIADGTEQVLKRAREVLAMGASQIKVMAGGGVGSSYDPIDVAQYTLEEMKAAVDAAENWGTYVTVHAYTPRAVRRALEAGVRCIEHGQLLDEDTIRLAVSKGAWLSLQPFLDDEDANPYPEGSPNREKQKLTQAGTDNAYRWAKKHLAKIAFGTDNLYNAAGDARQGAKLAKLTRWFAPHEVLRIATQHNAELLALSGERSPYKGKLGVVAEGALADLILVDGDPISNIKLIEDPAKNFLVIMKDGRLYKNFNNE